MTLRGRVVHLGIANPEDLVANPRLLAQGEAELLPRSALTVADDIVDGGQRKVLVVEVAVPQTAVQALAIFPQSDQPSIETGVPAPLGGTSPSPAAAGAQLGGGRLNRGFHERILRKRLRQVKRR